MRSLVMLLLRVSEQLSYDSNQHTSDGCVTKGQNSPWRGLNRSFPNAFDLIIPRQNLAML